MAVEVKDYCRILGIPREAGYEEVRKAFRSLMRICQAELANGDRTAEDRCKEVSEAYEVLGDPEMRQKFLEFSARHRPDGAAGAPLRSLNPGDSVAQPREARARPPSTLLTAGYSEFFEFLFGGQPAAPADDPNRAAQPGLRGAGTGNTLRGAIWVAIQEVAIGAVRPVIVRRAARCEGCAGSGLREACFCAVCGGAGTVPQLERFLVRIPRGVAEGTQLEIPYRADPVSQETGRLSLRVRYARHPDFEVKEGVLCHELELAPWEAVLGAEVSVPTLSGFARLRVPAGTRAGQRLRLRGLGLPSLAGRPGDLMVIIQVQMPESPRIKERQLWDETARASHFNSRGGQRGGG